MNRLLIFALLFVFSCSNSAGEQESSAAESVVDSTSTEQTPAENQSPPVSNNTNYSDANDSTELTAFIPAGYEILGFEYGDLNKDDLTTDALVALKVIGKEEAESTRPLLVLTRQADGSLKEMARNDYVVYCSACGGVMGDPFQALVIKDGYFSVEHFGGSRWKWLNVTTFKFDQTTDNWVLHRFGSESYDGFNPDSVETSSKTKKDFGQIFFEDFVDVN